MNPLEIFQKTPKTNCGKCGHPACLAFSAAVAKMGEDPSKCPFISEADLELLEPSAEKIDDLAREKDLALVQHLKSKIAALDFQKIAAQLGAVCPADAPDTLSFRYLGQDTLINKNCILINQTVPSDPRDQILLYNYVHCGGGQKPAENWIGLESLPNTISKIKTLEVYGEQPIAELFSGKEKKAVLTSCRNELDAKEVSGSSASIALLFPVLPLLPLQVLFWDAEPDDGFDAKVKVLFTENVLDYLDLESLVFTAERLSDRLHDILTCV
jgi:hypothetical protein